eukprot:TRINITY_DN17024_c0_g1_i1.p1 TRINITY_DN17024_c0_g1~~TRINITY_DN17024_c0_g1_i1.p1  ORF type:complete len:248 (-),score=73.38 TRINITY_DN17024_c0_g1_i1:33-776(-)
MKNMFIHQWTAHVQRKIRRSNLVKKKTEMELIEENGMSTIVLNDNENRFSGPVVARWNELLDIVEKSKSKALAITGTGKYFSNGLDLAWMGKNQSAMEDFLDALWKLQARLLVFPIPTVAIINGHAFGAGFFLALVCDFRVMKEDKGFMCAPEINLGFPLRRFKHVAKAKLNQEAFRTSILGGAKLNGAAAFKLQMVDYAGAEDTLVAVAQNLVKPLSGKTKSTMTIIKKELYEETYQGLIHPEAKL